LEEAPARGVSGNSESSGTPSILQPCKPCDSVTLYSSYSLTAIDCIIFLTSPPARTNEEKFSKKEETVNFKFITFAIKLHKPRFPSEICPWLT
jgi:hypothetical protein